MLAAHDGSQAVDFWNKHSAAIDLLLTDIVLPGDLSGADLVDKFHQHRPNLKIIFSSGYSIERAKITIAGLVESNYLPKPYDPETLIVAVRKCLFETP